MTCWGWSPRYGSEEVLIVMSSYELRQWVQAHGFMSGT